MDTEPISDITPDEIAELRAIRTAREAAANGTAYGIRTPESGRIVLQEPEVEQDATAPEDAPEPWPHRTMDFHGDTLEVRKPSNQALLAFSIASGGIDPQLQMRVFRMFLQNHLSPASFQQVLFEMANPENEHYALDELLKALVALPD